MIRRSSARNSSTNRSCGSKTEDMVRDVLKRSGINYVEVPNEAAFYGPKIDVQVWSVIGREFTIATNQVDFAVPRRFGLVYATATTPTRRRSASIARRSARTNVSSASSSNITPAISRSGSRPNRSACCRSATKRRCSITRAQF